MNNRDEIFPALRQMISEMFEIEPGAITPSASLADLDIDSIDAVDLMSKLREIIGRRVQPEEFKNVRTVGDVVAVLEKICVK